MRLAKSQIATNYGTAHDDGSVSIFVYRADGIKELKLDSANGEIKTDYRGPLFFNTEGPSSLQNLKMWLYYNNNELHACDLDVNWYELKKVLTVTPIDGAEPYELSNQVGTVIGVKDGLPFEIEWK